MTRKGYRYPAGTHHLQQTRERATGDHTPVEMTRAMLESDLITAVCGTCGHALHVGTLVRTAFNHDGYLVATHLSCEEHGRNDATERDEGTT